MLLLFLNEVTLHLLPLYMWLYTVHSDSMYIFINMDIMTFYYDV